jgi:hypothetical protein
VGPCELLGHSAGGSPPFRRGPSARSLSEKYGLQPLSGSDCHPHLRASEQAGGIRRREPSGAAPSINRPAGVLLLIRPDVKGDAHGHQIVTDNGGDSRFEFNPPTETPWPR